MSVRHRLAHRVDMDHGPAGGMRDEQELLLPVQAHPGDVRGRPPALLDQVAGGPPNRGVGARRRQRPPMDTAADHGHAAAAAESAKPEILLP